jgi:cbb3-type cytochrome oxidase cytochrome c subunit
MLELIISYDGSNSMPISAGCTMCGAAMSRPFPEETSSKGRITWFAAEFERHLESHHAATRVVAALGQSY